jgi:hypothetical protein
MALNAKPGRGQLVARELVLLRGLAADRRQASWLALVRQREAASRASDLRRGQNEDGKAQSGHPPEAMT